MSAKAPAGKTVEPVKFVADARLISVLGEQLIGSEKVGILELVKNAYDAGARTCTVTLEGVPGLDPKTRTLPDYAKLEGPIIEVFDTGRGMSRDDIVLGWLRPASSRRAQVKEQLRVERAAAEKRGTLSEYNALVGRLREEHGGRLPLGEKGIGRLATHRLGSHLWLRTKTADDPMEWELRIDWATFDALDGKTVDLTSVPLSLVHQPPTRDYGPDGSGTAICCYGGRSGYSWSHNQIIEVGKAISALRSPRKTPENFEPRFSSPHVNPDELLSPLDRHPAPFEIIAIVNEEGTADLEVHSRPPATLDVLKPYTKNETVDLRRANVDEWKQPGSNKLRVPRCGPFLVHIRAWLRIPAWLGADYKEVTTYLDEFGGITIYRDGLATMPAQQGATIDWLGLGAVPNYPAESPDRFRSVVRSFLDEA